MNQVLSLPNHEHCMGNAIKTFLVMLVVLSGCAPANTAKTAANEAVAEDPSGRTLPFHTVSLLNLKDFRNPKNTGWQVAGEASAWRSAKAMGCWFICPAPKAKGTCLPLSIMGIWTWNLIL